jgi:hypothetical protein
MIEADSDLDGMLLSHSDLVRLWLLVPNRILWKTLECASHREEEDRTDRLIYSIMISDAAPI